MKKLLVLGAGLVTLAAQGQLTNAPPATANESFERQMAHEAQTTPLGPLWTKPNEAVLGKVVLSGIAVQVVKAKNPLQLINPAAPEEYGQAEDNVVREPIKGKIVGLKFLAIRF